MSLHPVVAEKLETPSVSWSSLGRRAKTWRVVHASWSVAQLASLGYIWVSALTGRRSPRLWASVAFVAAEGAALVVGGGDCPVGPLQEEWGDPVPFFELVLPPRAAKAAVPVLAVVTVGGIAALVLRRPGLVAHAEPAATMHVARQMARRSHPVPASSAGRVRARSICPASRRLPAASRP